MDAWNVCADLRQVIKKSEIDSWSPGVLVVDDEAPVRQLLSHIIKPTGLTVWLAANGQEAIELFDGCSGSIKVALLDVHMPGLDGPETMQKLRAINPHLPCCFMTGNGTHDLTNKLFSLGARHVFVKPFRTAHIIHALRVLVLETHVKTIQSL